MSQASGPKARRPSRRGARTSGVAAALSSVSQFGWSVEEPRARADE
jgi:hypothetical protein